MGMRTRAAISSATMCIVFVQMNQEFGASLLECICSAGRHPSRFFHWPACWSCSISAKSTL
jgi:hypothetical protein